MTGIVSMVLLVLMAGSLMLVPIGVPGVWLMIVFLAVGLLMGTVGWTLWISLALLTAAAEIAEFFILKKMGDRVGASPMAFWAAVFGGIAGALIGAPIPVVGSVVAAFLGTFLGAGVVTLVQTRSVGDASRVGASVVIARTLAVGLKVAVGVVILVAGGLGMVLSR
jgi:uncharacterized protein